MVFMCFLFSHATGNILPLLVVTCVVTLTHVVLLVLKCVHLCTVVSENAFIPICFSTCHARVEFPIHQGQVDVSITSQ